MVYYDHALVGATLAVAAGVQRRHGWPAVALAALAGMFPDWDAATKHVRPDAYALGHRVWGHNLFAATLAGAALGGVGYLIHRSGSHRSGSHRSAPRPADAGGAAPWVVLGVAIAWSHPLLDLLYCGWEADLDWPVRLFWPLSGQGFGVPWVPWSDRGATAVLALGLLACVVARAHRRACAAATLAVLALYVGARGALL